MGSSPKDRRHGGAKPPGRATGPRAWSPDSFRAALISLLVLLAQGLASPAWAQDPADKDPTDEATGLTYRIEWPTNHAHHDQPRDLLVCLHGSGDTLPNFAFGLGFVVPEFRRVTRLFVQSPHQDGWDLSLGPKLKRLVAKVNAERPVRRVIAFGFSAGGYLSTALVFDDPGTFRAGLVGGATIARPPPRLPQGYLYFSIGAEDPLVERMGGVEAGLTRFFKQAEWPAERYRIELVPKLGHRLDRQTLAGGLDWLRARLDAEERASKDQRQKLAALPGLIEAGDGEGLDAAAKALLDDPQLNAAVLRRLHEALAPLLESKNERLLRVAIEAVGRCAQPEAGELLAEAFKRVRRDEDYLLTLVDALGQQTSPAASKALIDLLRRNDFRGRVRPHAARALAFAGDDSALSPLISALKRAEKRQLGPLRRAAEFALRELSGQKRLAGSRTWEVWRRKYR